MHVSQILVLFGVNGKPTRVINYLRVRMSVLFLAKTSKMALDVPFLSKMRQWIN